MKKFVPYLVVLMLLVLGGFKYYQVKNPEKVNSFIERTTSDSTSLTPERNAQISEGGAKVNVQTPINGTLYGVVEVGASGFNSFVVDIDKEDNYEVIYKEFGESLAYEGFMTTEDVKLGLKKYLSTIFSKGVSGRNVHFVMSSGALKNPKTKIIAEAIKKMGYVVNEVTAEQEGKYALRALLPKEYKDNSFTVDIGSGNTKISWYEGDKLKTVESYGAKFYGDGKTNAEVASDITSKMAQVPLKNRKNIFMIGGVPFKLAKENKTDARFVLLNNPDNYSAGDDAKLKSGLVIYRAIYETATPEQVIFDWDANFTIGLLLNLN